MALIKVIFVNTLVNICRNRGLPVRIARAAGGFLTWMVWLASLHFSTVLGHALIALYVRVPWTVYILKEDGVAILLSD